MSRMLLMGMGGPATAASTLLLDETGLGSAAAAFSVRKLRAAYAGNCLRVRRSSDNAESDIGFVANYLDTATMLTFCGAGNGFVVTWYDQSGNARNATQATAANQPQIVSSGALITGANSKAAMTYDGTNDGLNTAGFTLSQPYTFEIVAYQVTWTGNDYILDGSGVGNTTQFAQRTSTPTVGLGSTPLTTAGWAVTTWANVTCVHNNTSSVIGINAAAETTGTAGTGNPGGVSIASFGAGVGNFANISLSEVVYWASGLDGTARATSKSNVMTYFAL